jgi:putative tricarboxylic transport membrane protein
MRVLGVPVAPAVIGLILGPLAEVQFRRALSISQGDWTVFFTDPFSLALLIMAALALLGPFVWRWRGRRRQLRGA